MTRVTATSAPPTVRVAFDGRTLASPAGGVRRYAIELFTALADHPEVVVVSVGGPAHVPRGMHVVAERWSLPTNLGWAVSGLPAAADRAGYDVFHAPAYTAPLRRCRPLVVSIHDVSYARRPEFYPYRRDPLRRAFYKASAKRADRIVTCSSFSKAEITAAYGIDPDGIDVVPLAAAAVFARQPGRQKERVVLHVGDLHPRRNLHVLVDAVGELKRSEAHAADVTLVLAGVDRGELEGLRAQAARLQMPDLIRYVGTPADHELVDWYNRASVVAYPSSYEGFGLPVLEAMACGTPVVASASASIPEVAGDAAMLMTTHDIRAWRDAIGAVLQDPALAGTLSDQGVRRAAAFSWQRTAAETLDAYRRAIRDHEQATQRR
jgi:glycosyltransferase involved in cell wall biosynthesis